MRDTQGQMKMSKRRVLLVIYWRFEADKRSFRRRSEDGSWSLLATLIINPWRLNLAHQRQKLFIRDRRWCIEINRCSCFRSLIIHSMILIQRHKITHKRHLVVKNNLTLHQIIKKVIIESFNSISGSLLRILLLIWSVRWRCMIYLIFRFKIFSKSIQRIEWNALLIETFRLRTRQHPDHMIHPLLIHCKMTSSRVGHNWWRHWYLLH